MRAAELVVVLALGVSVTAGAPAGAAPPPPAVTIAVAAEVAAEATSATAGGVSPVQVEKLARPGRLMVTNPNDQWVRFLWGTFRQGQPDGRKRIEAHRTVVIRVHRHRIDWIAMVDGYQVAGQGSVRGIRL